MAAFCRKNWFFIGMAVVFVVAFQLPDLALALKKLAVVKMLICLAFFITGLTLDTSGIVEQLKNVKVLLASLVSSLVLTTTLAYLVGRVFFTNPDFLVGALIIGAAPVTVASGSVMTAIALGNVSMSLFICVVSNLASLVSIPFMLQIFLSMDQGIELPVFQMLSNLFLTLFLPTLLGQLLRPRLKDFIKPYKSQISVFMQSVVLMIVFNAVSASSERMMNAGSHLVMVLGVMLFLHLMILVMNYGISRLMRLDRPSTSAFTIHNSQKTLTISYVVWAGFFAADFPMALIPGIAYHLLQMVVDTLVARRMRDRAEAALAEAPT